MPKTRILYLITKATRGGAQKYVHDLAVHLSRDTFEIAVAYGEHGQLADDLERSGIRTVRVPFLGRETALVSDTRSFFAIRKLFSGMRPDVVHLNSSKAAALGALAARFTGIPNIVLTVHGWPHKEDRNFVWKAFIYLVSWVTALAAHKVITVSISDLRIGKRMLFVGRKTICIPLGRERVALLAPQVGFQKMFGALAIPQIREDTLRIVTIAELTHNKGIRWGIDTIRELTDRGLDAIYVVAGEGELRDQLTKYASSKGVGDRVFFPGFVPAVASNLAGFDVFMLPSLKEGAPYVLLEAGMAGLPIVATNAIDKEFAAQFENVRLTPLGDPLAMADAIVELYRRPRSPSKESRFSLHDMVAKKKKLYVG